MPETPSIIGLDDLFVASIDRTDMSQDAVALPPGSGYDTDQPPGALASPPAAGTEFALDGRGLVDPTSDGALTPDGVLVYSGAPPRKPPATPPRDDPEAEIAEQQTLLAGLRPRARPGDLIERNERSQLGGLTRDELAGLRPRTRPASLQEAAQPEAELPPTAQAIAASVRPDARPGDFASTVQVALARQPAPSQAEQLDDEEPETTVAAAVQPRIPSSASVARQATLNNAINLRQVNLIGVYGTPSNRRALVRLPSGRYKKVQVGDTVDGGRIVAIGDSELRYQKGSRNLTLKIPSG